VNFIPTSKPCSMPKKSGFPPICYRSNGTISVHMPMNASTNPAACSVTRTGLTTAEPCFWCFGIGFALWMSSKWTHWKPVTALLARRTLICHPSVKQLRYDVHILVMGAGRFGQKAIRHFQTHVPNACLTVVDRDGDRLSPFGGTSIHRVCSDAVAYLNQVLPDLDISNDWIIPAVPIHLAFEWMLQEVGKEYRIVPIAFPEDILQELPNRFYGPFGTVYTSIADFRCPDGCPAPESHCTYTGLPRPLTMDRYLQTIGGRSYRSIVVQSVQIGPGVGGYHPQALLSARDGILEAVPRSVLLTTACRCHAVVSALWIARQGRARPSLRHDRSFGRRDRLQPLKSRFRGLFPDMPRIAPVARIAGRAGELRRAEDTDRWSTRCSHDPSTPCMWK